MTVKEIQQKSGLKPEVAESLYWHCLWIRTAPADTKVQWGRLLKDKEYRLKGNRQ